MSLFDQRAADLAQGTLSQGARTAQEGLGRDRKVFELAFGFIPQVNIGTALGIEDPFSRFVVDAILDPLNFVASPVTALGKASKASKFLSSSRKMKQAKKLVNAANYSARDAKWGTEFLDAVQRGDVATLRSRFAKDLDNELPETTKFFSGSDGRAIKRAIFSDEPVTPLRKGASAQADAGQLRLFGVKPTLFGFDVFGESEITVLSGRTLFRMAEAVPLVGDLFRNLGARRIRQMSQTLGKKAPLTVASGRAVEAAGLVYGAERVAVEAGTQPGRKVSREAQALARSAETVQDALVDYDLVLSRHRIESVAPESAVAMLSVEADNILRSKKLKSAAEGLDARKYERLDRGDLVFLVKASETSRRVGGEAASALAPKLYLLGRSLDGPLGGVFSRAAQELEQGGTIGRKWLENEAKSLRAAADELESSVLSADELAKLGATKADQALAPGLKAEANAEANRLIAAAGELEDALPSVFSTAPGGSLNAEELAQSLDRTTLRLQEALESYADTAKGFAEARAKGLDGETAGQLADLLRAVQASLVEASPSVSVKFEEAVQVLAPKGAVKGAPLRTGVETSADALADDVLVGLTPRVADADGRVARGALGFSPDDPDDLVTGLLGAQSIQNKRIDALGRVLDQGFRDVAGIETKAPRLPSGHVRRLEGMQDDLVAVGDVSRMAASGRVQPFGETALKGATPIRYRAQPLRDTKDLTVAQLRKGTGAWSADEPIWVVAGQVSKSRESGLARPGLVGGERAHRVYTNRYRAEVALNDAKTVSAGAGVTGKRRVMAYLSQALQSEQDIYTHRATGEARELSARERTRNPLRNTPKAAREGAQVRDRRIDNFRRAQLEAAQEVERRILDGRIVDGGTAWEAYVEARGRHQMLGQDELFRGHWDVMRAREGTALDVLGPAHEVGLIAVRPQDLPKDSVVTPSNGSWLLHADVPLGSARFMDPRRAPVEVAFQGWARKADDADLATFVQSTTGQDNAARAFEAAEGLGLSPTDVRYANDGAGGAAGTFSFAAGDRGAAQKFAALAAEATNAKGAMVFEANPAGKSAKVHWKSPGSATNAEAFARAHRELGMVATVSGDEVVVYGPASELGQYAPVPSGSGRPAIKNGQVKEFTYGEYFEFDQQQLADIRARGAGSGPGGRGFRDGETVRSLVARSGAPLGAAATRDGVRNALRRTYNALRGDRELTGLSRGSRTGGAVDADRVTSLQFGDELWAAVERKPDGAGSRSGTANYRAFDPGLSRAEAQNLLEEGQELVRVRAIDGDAVVREADGTNTFISGQDDLVEGLDFHRGQGFIEDTLDLPPFDKGPGLEKFRDRFEKELIDEFNVPDVEGAARRLESPDPRGTAKLYGNRATAVHQADGLRTMGRMLQGKTKPGRYWDQVMEGFNTKWDAPLGQRLLRAAFPEMSEAELKLGVHRGFLPGTKRSKRNRVVNDPNQIYDRTARLMDAARSDPELRPRAWDVPDRRYFERVDVDDIGLLDASVDATRAADVNPLTGEVSVVSTGARAIQPSVLGGENKVLDFMRALGGSEKSRKALGAAAEGALRVVDRFFKKLEAHGHGDWWDHVGQPYFRQILKPARGVDQEVYERAVQAVMNAWKSGADGRNALARASRRIEKIASGAKPPFRVVGNGSEIVTTYARTWSNAIFQQRLVDRLARARTLDGSPILVSKAHKKRLLGSVTRTNTEAQQLFSAYRPSTVPALRKYEIHKDFPLAEQIFGPQSLRAAIDEDGNPFWRTLQRLNLHMKGATLSFSAFHLVALGQSLLAGNFFQGAKVLAGAVAEIPGLRNTPLAASMRSWASQAQSLSPDLRAGAFLEVFGEAGEVFEQAMRSGLQLDTFQRIAEEGLVEFASNLDRAVQDAQKGSKGYTIVGDGPGGLFKVLRSPLTGAVNVNKALNHATWEVVHNSGKVQMYAMHLESLMKKFPEAPISQLQRQAAETANAQMGGLNWRRVFGNAKVRQGLQMFMLAPDWTFANLIVARDVLVGFAPDALRRDSVGRFAPLFRDMVSPDAASFLARKYWINHAMSVFLGKQVFSLARNGHTTFENPGTKTKDKLNVLLGEDPDNGAPIFLHTGKQFGEPFELAFDNGLHLALRKAAPALKVASSIVMNRKHAGVGAEQISLPSDSTGIAALKNIGYAATEPFTPIPLATGLDAAAKAARGNQGARIEAMNVLLGSLDFPIRRHYQDAKDGEVKKPSKPMGLRFPTSVLRDAVPAWETRMMELRR